MFDTTAPPHTSREIRTPSPAELALRYGQRTINGMIGGKSAAWVYEHARIAGSFARITLEARELERRAVPVERNSAVHPLMRDLVNMTTAQYGVPMPEPVETDEPEDSRVRR